MIELGLDSKISIGKVVVADALRRFRAPVVVWSAGKECAFIDSLMIHECKYSKALKRKYWGKLRHRITMAFDNKLVVIWM